MRNCHLRFVPISLACVAGPVFAEAAKQAPCVEAVNQVFAAQDWQIVSPNVQAGDLLQFDATGKWTYVKGAGHSSGPNGYAPTPTDAEPFRSAFKLPSAAIGVLIAKIGNNAPFVVGASTVMSSPSSGPLYMRMNDVNHEDNDGDVIVKTKLCRNA